MSYNLITNKNDKIFEYSPSTSIKEKYQKLEKEDPHILQQLGEFFSNKNENSVTSYQPIEKDTKITRLISRPLNNKQDSEIEVYEIKKHKIIHKKECCIII
jgi:hypothetical protein